MFEFTVSCDQNELIINNIFSGLKNVIDSLNGIIIKQSSLKTDCVCLAVENQHKEYVKAVILDIVSDAIISKYKFDYLQRNISVTIKNSVAYNAFVRALVVFDRQTDKDIIKKNLVLENKLNIDSFYNFRLDQLKNRWNDIAQVVNESIPVMLQNKSVADITRYFVESTSKEINEMHVYLCDRCIKLGVGNETDGLGFDANADYIENVLTEIISVSPKKIIVHGNTDNYKELEKALNEVFSDNVYVTK